MAVAIAQTRGKVNASALTSGNCANPENAKCLVVRPESDTICS
jgi:hypothetical protein